MRKFLLVILTLFAAVGMTYAQRTVSGTVTDAEGEPLIGVSVVVKGTTTGTITDLNGEYELEVPEAAVVLTFSYVGLETVEQEVPVSMSKADIVMSEEAKVLDEVVVTALGFQQDKSKIGVAQSSVDGERLVHTGESRLINSLAGKTPGVNIVQSTGDPGAGSKIQIRGATSILGSLEPLIVVDGVPVYNDSYYGEGFGGNDAASAGSLGSGGGVTQQSRMNDINPEDIESVEILRGASAAALWGSRAANGVIVITTKKGPVEKDFEVSISSSFSIDEVNQQVPLNSKFGQGYDGFWVEGTSLSWGDKIADRPGGSDMSVTTPGQFFDADGNDLYGGKFESDVSNNVYYSNLPALTDIYDANGNLIMTTDEHGGKFSRATYNPYDQIFENGYTWDNTLGISSRSENGSLYFSAGYMSNDGVALENSTYDRFTARLNGARQLGNNFSTNVNLGFVNSTSERVQMGSNLNGLFLGGLRSAQDFYDSDYVGTYTDPSGTQFVDRQRAYRNPLGAGTNSIYDNPIWMMHNITSDNLVNRVYGKAEIRYEPTNWLNFTARGGLDHYADEREDFFPALSAGENNGGRFVKETITRQQTSFDLIGRARFNLADQIDLSAMVGGGISQSKLDDHGVNSRSFVNPFSPPQLDNATNIIPFNEEETLRIAGLYGSLGFEFYDQVFLNASFRNDWLSALPEDDNSVFYPAFDLAWEFTKLVDPNNILSYGKLRGGWGQVGRQPFSYITTTGFFAPTAANTGWGEGWGPGVNPNAYGGGFAVQTVAGNPNIKPEIKTEFEIGADFRLWKNRINLSYTYYNNETDDLILQVDLPESAGFLSVFDNVGKVENTGHEIEFGIDVWRQQDFDWNIYGNWTTNDNEVVEMGGTNSVFIGGFSDGSSRAVVGEPLGVQWGARWAREADGSFALDENGFPTLASESGVIGDPNPDFRTGLGTIFSWRDLSLNVLFDMSEGGDMWNGTRGALAYFGRAEYTTQETTLTAEQATTVQNYVGMTAADLYPFAENSDGSYTIRGEIRDYGGGPVLIDEYWYYVGPGSGFTGPDEQFVEDASWKRLREVSLSYNFSSEGLRQATRIENVGITITARNLKLWTDYQGNDPDQSLTGPGVNGFGLDYFQNPSTKTYQFSLNLTF